MGELESTVNYVTQLLREQKRHIFWLLSCVLLLWLLLEVKEVTTLLLASYAIALLLDPVVQRFGRWGIGRGAAVLIIGLICGLFVALLLLLAIPALLEQYQILVENLPHYLHEVLLRFKARAQGLGFSQSLEVESLSAQLRDYLKALDLQQLRKVAAALGQTLLSGYSLTLTLFNLLILPFFVFYLVRDMAEIHKFLSSFIRPDLRVKIATLGGMILSHVYAFFKGQVTVALLLSLFYVIGLSLVGCKSALIIGLLAGLLNVVPYLGVATGLLLSTTVTLVSDPSWTQLLLVWGVFAVVQFLEGTFVTPKIVGEQVGIHPLGVMLALIIGGDLAGLLGLILAIPTAAAVRVLFNYLHSMLDDVREEDLVEVFGGTPKGE